MNNNLRQIIYDMRTQPVIAWVTVLGTALSIFLIMTVLMMQMTYQMNFEPETHRDRMLYGKFFHIEGEGSTGSANLSFYRAKQLYGDLEGIEEQTYMSPEAQRLDVKGSTGESFTANVRRSDDAFWRVFEFKLLKGRYYTADEVAANTRVAVISESTARRLFAGEEPVGRHFLLDHNDFEVIGVTRDVSQLATVAFGDVFIPINIGGEFGGWDRNFGNVMTSMLIKEGTDFESIRRQVIARYAEADTELGADGQRTVYHEGPFNQEVIASGLRGSNVTPDLSGERIIHGLIYAILLLVPAINLSSMLHSRLRRRISDIGVRRAFGCTRSRIITDIITENLVVTVIGGVIGLGSGVLFALYGSGLYTSEFGEDINPSLSILLNWRVLGAAFIACFVLNIISAAIPAWHASRVNPVEAINAK